MLTLKNLKVDFSLHFMVELAKLIDHFFSTS